MLYEVEVLMRRDMPLPGKTNPMNPNSPTRRIEEMTQRIYGERTYGQDVSRGYGLSVPATGLWTTLHIVA